MRETSSAHTTRLVLPLTALLLCVTAVASAGGPESAYPVQVDSGWNLLSLPAVVSNGSKAFLFPSATSAAFVFRDPIGYEELDTLQSGVGFWLKFNSSETVFITGELIFKDTIEVHAGWNIVGSLSVPIAVDSIVSEPPGMITSVFSGFRPGVGYEEADTLHPGFGYWVKVNQDGRIVLPSGSALPCPGVPTVLYAGKIYHTVQIGSQCWLKENLDVGAMIQSSEDQTNNSIIEKYCYDNIPANCDSFGAYFQWDEVMQYDSGAAGRGICPPGWHIPTLAQFQIMSAAVADNGNALKAVGQGSDAGAGTNTSGFSGLLAGNRSTDGSFYYLGEYGYTWTSTVNSDIFSYLMYLHSTDSLLGLSWGLKADGFNARCMQDHDVNVPPGIPFNPVPLDSSTGQPRFPTLRWSCSDPEGDRLAYTVYFGRVGTPDSVVAVNQHDTSLAMIDLSPETTYRWRVVVTDSYTDSTSGPVWSFATGLGGGGIPCPGMPTVDYAGRTYNTVLIGTQCWLRENLDAGTMILGNANQTNNSTMEKYCYDDQPANCDTYGGLYQWNEAMQYSLVPGGQGVCPPAWHVPTYWDLDTLRTAVADDGNALKDIGQGSGAGAGTNTSGFSALLAGSRYLTGDFIGFGTIARFWSSSEGEAVHHLYLIDINGNVFIAEADRPNGFSVRCLKD
jgi:uncharacterized protein (TIGR02145 family)